MENLCEVKISITKGRKENKGPLVISRVASNRAIHGHQARSRAYLCHSDESLSTEMEFPARRTDKTKPEREVLDRVRNLRIRLRHLRT